MSLPEIDLVLDEARRQKAAELASLLNIVATAAAAPWSREAGKQIEHLHAAILKET